jgi:hypothetical protein
MPDLAKVPEKPWYSKYQQQCSICSDRAAWCRCEREAIRIAIPGYPAALMTMEVKA